MFTRNKIHVLLPFCLLLSFIALGMMACANAADGNSAGYGMTPGRLEANIAAVVGLISVVIGGLALARSAGKRRAIVALAVGLIGMILSVVHLSRSTGGFGTGSGRAGAIVALVLGLIGTILGGLAMARFRRSPHTD